MSRFGDINIALRLHDLVLMPEKTLYHTGMDTLIAADVHLGKSATFRSFGIAIPPGTTEENLARLSRALERTKAARLIMLGDLIHAKRGKTDATIAAVAAWREKHAGVDILVVRGNHDRHAGDPPASWDMRCVDAPHMENGFAFCHHPTPVLGAYTFAGHLHPAVKLRGPGRTKQSLACFWIGARLTVLPAFGSFTGTVMVRPQRGDGVYVIAEDEVVTMIPYEEKGEA